MKFEYSVVYENRLDKLKITGRHCQIKVKVTAGL